MDLKISLFLKCLTFANIALALFKLEVRSCMWIFQFKFSSTFIPRYLKYFVLQSLFLHNFSLKLVSQGLCLVLKSITSVFAKFNGILFAFKQNESSFKSLLTFRNYILNIKQTRIICKVKRLRELYGIMKIIDMY